MARRRGADRRPERPPQAGGRRCVSGAIALLLLATAPLHADERTQRLVSRLAEEADAFGRLAPQVLGEELLHQRALKPPPRFRPRIGEAARRPPQPSWQQREIRSEYSFASFTGEGGALHELRQVIAVDGKKIQDAKKAQEALARAVTARDDARKQQLLRDFERHGLLGAATDFGQTILLFTPRDIVHYEFRYAYPSRLDERAVLVFRYRQLDGPEALTVIDARKQDQASQLRIEGEVWVLEDSYMPVKIRVEASRGAGAAMLRQEAEIRYAMSAYGALLPVITEHREIRGEQVVAENRFTYAGFRKFGASSEIRFEAEPEPTPAPPGRP